MGVQCTYNIVVQIKDQYVKIKITFAKLRKCRCLRGKTTASRVKILSEAINPEKEFPKQGT